MMSFAPKGIPDSLPLPVGLCGNTWTQGWMEESMARMRSRHGCNASSRILGGAFNHSVSVSRRGLTAVAAGAAVAAAKLPKSSARRSILRLSKLVTAAMIVGDKGIRKAQLRQRRAPLGTGHMLSRV